MKFIDLSAQYRVYKSEIDVAIQSVLDSSQFIMGKEVSSLEQELAHYCQIPYAKACSSGTDALLLALMAIDVQPGDEVITTPFTFIATAESIALLKARPVFVDIDPNTYNIDANKIAEKITKKTKAIMPVSVFGQPADMNEINYIASEHNLTVIEDGAQSFGAEYQGKKSCSLSSLACTSFFPAKGLGCYGDGGAVFTSDPTHAEKISALLNHGQTQRYVHSYLGINGRLDAIQAAILRVKLKHFDDEIIARRRIAASYDRAFASVDSIQNQLIAEDRNSIYSQYSLVVDDRDAIVAALHQQNIPTAIHYPIALHLQQVFAPLGYVQGDFPQSEYLAKHIFSLPMSAFLTETDQSKIIDSVMIAIEQTTGKI